MNKIYYDSVIFSLQKYGGIGNYWNELLKGVKRYSEFCNYSSNTDQMKNMNKMEALLNRYSSVVIKEKHSIFHSSYYRRCSDKKVKKVVTVYDFMYEKYAYGFRRSVHQAQKSSAINDADIILCISNNTKHDLEEMFPSSREKPIIVTHLGVDHNKYYLENKTDELINEKIILFVGKRSEYKRFDVAVRLLKELKGYKLGIVGEELNQYEKNLLSKLIKDRYIHFGKVDDNQLRLLYNKSFCMLFPSEYEGFGLPLLEAQACGCPVIASRTSSLIEIGADSVIFGNNFDIGSYIESISYLEKNEQRDEIINLGIENSKKYTWHECIDKTVNAYRILC